MKSGFLRRFFCVYRSLMDYFKKSVIWVNDQQFRSLEGATYDYHLEPRNNVMS